MPYKTSFSIIIIKTPFLNSLLISLRHESINKTSYIRINISINRSYFINILIRVK